ncbi:formate dehydrogenase subunit delta [Roseomonas sp. KE2513]|uniref:formate dehydrogenase subunit delta n=1 Tax=Roseomonas sp. KE2513 TaxID=2479202 RepID=UPI002815A9AC|nr:formate dehydrogenase subunit delta [Roseomonas sp. KE2513]
MSDKEEKLARMANGIADFFRSYPAEEARAGIADHIRSFWTRVMRDELHQLIAHGGGGLDPLVLGAFSGKTLGESPILKETGGPDEVGQLGSDAG